MRTSTDGRNRAIGGHHAQAATQVPGQEHCLHGWIKTGHRGTFRGILSTHPPPGCESKLRGIPGICPGQIRCDVKESVWTPGRCTEMRELWKPPWFESLFDFGN